MHEHILTLHNPCVQETPMKHPPTRDLGKTWHRPFLPGVFQAVCDNSSLLNCLGREHCQTRGTIRGVSREMGWVEMGETLHPPHRSSKRKT